MLKIKQNFKDVLRQDFKETNQTHLIFDSFKLGTRDNGSISCFDMFLMYFLITNRWYVMDKPTNNVTIGISKFIS